MPAVMRAPCSSRLPSTSAPVWSRNDSKLAAICCCCCAMRSRIGPPTSLFLASSRARCMSSNLRVLWKFANCTGTGNSCERLTRITSSGVAAAPPLARPPMPPMGPPIPPEGPPIGVPPIGPPSGAPPAGGAPPNTRRAVAPPTPPSVPPSNAPLKRSSFASPAPAAEPAITSPISGAAPASRLPCNAAPTPREIMPVGAMEPTTSPAKDAAGLRSCKYRLAICTRSASRPSTGASSSNMPSVIALALPSVPAAIVSPTGVATAAPMASCAAVGVPVGFALIVTGLPSLACRNAASSCPNERPNCAATACVSAKRPVRFHASWIACPASMSCGVMIGWPPSTAPIAIPEAVPGAVTMRPCVGSGMIGLPASSRKPSSRKLLSACSAPYSPAIVRKPRMANSRCWRFCSISFGPAPGMGKKIRICFWNSSAPMAAPDSKRNDAAIKFSMASNCERRSSDSAPRDASGNRCCAIISA